jgi:hypothetical protein
MTPGPEDDIPQSEKRRVMRQDADVRHGDTDAYLERHAPALAPGRQLPELSEAEKEQIKKRIAEAEKQHASTYHQRAQSSVDVELGGRFAKLAPTTVTGQDPAKAWPTLPASSPWSGTPPDYVEPRDASAPPVDRPPGTLGGYRLLSAEEIRQALESLTVSSSFPVGDTGGAPSPPPRDDVAAPPPPSKQSKRSK